MYLDKMSKDEKPKLNAVHVREILFKNHSELVNCQLSNQWQETEYW